MRGHRSLAFAALLVVGLSCSGTPDRAAAVSAHRDDSQVERVAGGLMARARAAEPGVSSLLWDLAEKVGGRLAGFEHRLKKPDSLIRKIHKELDEQPAARPDQVAIDDALRYTLLVDDRPTGHHRRVIRAVFGQLESSGHRVVEVKNYWPRGDNYSGVNSVLVAPGGLRWELQFHTTESFRVKTRDHHLYERMRNVATSAADKRTLYRKLTAPWERVPIPHGILAPGALHQVDRVILRPPPEASNAR